MTPNRGAYIIHRNAQRVSLGVLDRWDLVIVFVMSNDGSVQTSGKLRKLRIAPTSYLTAEKTQSRFYTVYYSSFP